MGKRIFTILSRTLVVLLFAGCMLSANAEKRIYFVGDMLTLTDPAWVMYGVDDINRELWIWDQCDGGCPDRMTTGVEAGAEMSPTGGMYMQWTVLNNWAGFNYTLLEGQSMDLTEITDDWYLVVWVKTNIAQDIQVVFNGINGTSGTLKLTSANLPLRNRDDIAWTKVVIPAYELFDQGLSYKQPLEGVLAYLLCSFGGTPNVHKLAFSDIYFTDTEPTTGIQEVKQTLEFSLKDDVVSLAEGVKAAMYDAQGKLVMEFEKAASIAHLPQGMYILKSDNKTAKLLK